MTEHHLDVNDRLAVIDFLLEHLEYLPLEDALRERAEAVIHDVEEGRNTVSKEDLVELARDVGKASWVPRVTLRGYLRTKDGQFDEWRRVVAAVSNSTAHLLERFRAGTKRDSVDEILEHEESSQAFRDQERHEIEQVRIHILPAMWREKQKDFASSIRAAEQRLAEIESRISALREIGFASEKIDETEVIEKIEHLEDELYFRGEVLDLEVLDAELAYYKGEA